MEVIVRSGCAGPSEDRALRTMFEDRKSVFVDLLKWDVPVIDGRFEVDEFDDEQATYAWTCVAAFSRKRPGHARRPPGPKRNVRSAGSPSRGSHASAPSFRRSLSLMCNAPIATHSEKRTREE